MSSVATTELIHSLNMEPHPEEGYFVVTDVQDRSVPSPFADAQARPLGSSIFYLLSHDRPVGFIHMNKSVTYHVLHQGRAEYTLIRPGEPPQVERRVVGCDVVAGGTRMLVVGSGVWKMSRLLPGDLGSVKQGGQNDHANCLITEVVVPGFDWQDHEYMSMEQLEGLFGTVEGGADWIVELAKFIKPEVEKA